ncbi:hypothetical protein FBU30_009197 [Linnemannia zychae]|nr:hypothetical protein FBU30_009197 [Linnemannia zychae]
MASTQLENEQSELEFNRDLIISNTNSNNNIIHLNNINKNDPDTMMESPLAAHHPHIIYSTVPAETAIITATDTSAKVIRSSTKTTSSDVTPRSMILDLDRGSTQATGAVETTLLPVQFNSTPLDSTEENITIPSIHDHLRFQGEINFDKPSQDHCLHSQWTDSLSECNYSNTSSIKGDGSRFKDPIESHVRGMGRERKRSTGVTYDGMSSDRKRRKNQPDWGYKHSSSTGLATSTETTVHLLRFLEKRLEQRCPSSITTCSTMKESNKSLVFKKKSALDFDPFLLLKTWSSLESSPKAFPEMRSSTGSLLSSPLSCNKRRIPRHRQPYQNSLICRQQHDVPEKCQCRKRAFADAFEFSQPFTMNAEVACYHPNWIESIKKRKIHQNATKWTSALSPAPYVRLLTLRNFWEMMEPRQDLTWRIIENNTQSEKDDNTEVEEQSQELNESGNISIPSEMEAETEIISIKNMTRQKIVARRNSRSNSVRTVKHVPCPGHFLRGLWEEEIRDQRIRQMIPDTVRKPIRGKIYHAKPIMTIIKQNKPSLLNFLTADTSSSNSATISAEGIAAESKNDSSTVDKKDSICEPSQDTTITSSTELELSLKKKHRAAAIIRSHAITEGSDMSEYKPWKDGTVVPRQGSLQALKASRSNIMDPWPVEEAKSKDMCMRVLHRMREQLNIVINLQIHLRSMMKTAPAQWSFLLSIRHPGQVSIELLLALYGPHFMQTSNFRAIEELLWGAKGHSQQAASSSIEAVAAASSNPALV